MKKKSGAGAAKQFAGSLALLKTIYAISYRIYLAVQKYTLRKQLDIIFYTQWVGHTDKRMDPPPFLALMCVCLYLLH